MPSLRLFPYSLYLVHEIVVREVRRAFHFHLYAPQVDAATLLILVSLSLAASIAVARCFHTAVERRFLNPPRDDARQDTVRLTNGQFNAA